MVTDNPDLPIGQKAQVFNLDVNVGVDDLDTSLCHVEVYDSDGQVYLPSTLPLDAVELQRNPAHHPVVIADSGIYRLYCAVGLLHWSVGHLGC